MHIKRLTGLGIVVLHQGHCIDGFDLDKSIIKDFPEVCGHGCGGHAEIVNEWNIEERELSWHAREI